MGKPQTTAARDVLPDRRAVWRQVRYDLFETKDVQDTPTFSYTWMADQGGHFSLGFLPTYLFAWIVAILGDRFGFDTDGWNVWLGLGVFGIWVIKEMNDFRLAVRNATRSRSDFRFNGRELFLNIGTAWLFFAMGSAVASLSFVRLDWALISLVPVVLITLGVGYWWLRRKITFQQSGLPYLYRLATFPNNIPVHPPILEQPPTGMSPEEAKAFLGLEEAKTFIGRMIVPGLDWGGHLILSGVPNAGKSSLAVGIGTEFVFELGLCRYLTLVKLLQFTSSNKAVQAGSREVRHNEEFNDGRVLWRWDHVELLIVDDVDDIARVGHEEDATPEQIEEYRRRVGEVLKQRFNSILGELQGRRRTLWVCNDPVNPLALKGLLEGILGYTDVKIIDLQKTLPQAMRDKGLKY